MFSRSKLLMALCISLLGLGCSGGKHHDHDAAPKDAGSDAGPDRTDASPGDMLDGSTMRDDAGNPRDDAGRVTSDDGGPLPHQSDASMDESDAGPHADASVTTKSSFAFCTDMRVTRDGSGIGDTGGELYRGDVVLRTSWLDPSFGSYSIVYMRGDGSIRSGSVAAADVEDTCPDDMVFAYYVTQTATLFKSDNSADCTLEPGTLLRPRSAHEASGWVSMEFDTPPQGCSALTGSVEASRAFYVLAYPSDEPELPVLSPSRRAGTASNRCAIRQGAIELDGYDVIHVQDDAERIAKLQEANDSGVCKPGNQLSALNAYIFLNYATLVTFTDEQQRFSALMQLANAGVGDGSNTCRMQNGDLYSHQNFLFAPESSAQIVDAFTRLTKPGVCTRIARISNVLGYLSLDGRSLLKEDTIEQFIDDMVTLAESGAAEPGGVCTLQSYCIAVDGTCVADITDARAAFNQLVQLGKLGTCAPHTSP